ncbi:MAG: hypothetical protein KDC43_13530 [Saprospiraceae bacterium]|nr:hypothetical protein [Saprospiraceae bacterium]MCB0624897.1 hypothetical protein [Saprospiraceae bacterium]
MKKYTFFFVLLSFAILSEAGAQPREAPATLQWGKEYREPGNSFLSKVISAGKNQVYALREKRETAFASNSKVYLEQYDAELKLERSREIDLKYNGKERDLEEFMMLGRELYLLTSFNNQAHKKNYLFVQPIDRKRLAPSRDLQMIAETEASNRYAEGTFDFHISRDSSKLLIYNQLPYKRKDPERFALRVFDDRFQPLWSRDLSLPYSDEMFSVEEYRVDNAGNVYLLGVLYEDLSQQRRRGKPTYQYIVLAYTGGGAEVQEYRIDLDDKFITDLTFRVADGGDLVCSGFYSERGTYSIKGTYFFRLNPQTREVYNKSLRQFDFDFITEDLSEKGKEKAMQAELEDIDRRKPELYDYDLRELVLRSDGGALMVAEQYYIYERTYYHFDGTWRTTYYYNYNDIIIVNIRPNGEIEWASRIPKRQLTIDDGGYFSSYAMAIVRDRIFFVYNDNGRNFDGRGPDRLYNYNGKNSVITLSEVRIDGSVSTYPMYSNREAEIITRPKICQQTASRQMLIYGENGRRYKFAHLQFL